MKNMNQVVDKAINNQQFKREGLSERPISRFSDSRSTRRYRIVDSKNKGKLSSFKNKAYDKLNDDINEFTDRKITVTSSYDFAKKPPKPLKLKGKKRSDYKKQLRDIENKLRQSKGDQEMKRKQIEDQIKKVEKQKEEMTAATLLSKQQQLLNEVR